MYVRQMSDVKMSSTFTIHFKTTDFRNLECYYIFNPYHAEHDLDSYCNINMPSAMNNLWVCLRISWILALVKVSIRKLSIYICYYFINEWSWELVPMFRMQSELYVFWKLCHLAFSTKDNGSKVTILFISQYVGKTHPEKRNYLQYCNYTWTASILTHFLAAFFSN